MDKKDCGDRISNRIKPALGISENLFKFTESVNEWRGDRAKDKMKIPKFSIEGHDEIF